MLFGIHAYAWTNHWSNTHLDLIERAKQLDLDFIEIPLMDLQDVDAAAIRARIQSVALGVVTSTVLNASTDITSDDAAVRAAGLDYLLRCVEVTAAMGARQCSGVIYSEIGRRPPYRSDERHWAWAADALRKVADYASTLGVTIGVEPVNRYETFLLNTSSQAAHLCAMIGRANVGIHLDTYHMNIEEKQWDDPLLEAGSRLCHLHLCENDRGIPGTGLIDWKALFGALAVLNYQGYAGLESFVDVSDDMRPATPIWRDLAPSGDVLVRDGLAFLKRTAAEAVAQVARERRDNIGDNEIVER